MKETKRRKPEKELGNEQFKSGCYEQAIVHFSEAIDLGPRHALYSNRFACCCGLYKYEQALKDAEKCIEMNSSRGKDYGRKGAALHGRRKYDGAIAAYEKGLAVEPGLAMLTKGLEDAKAEARRNRGGGLSSLDNTFRQPDVLQRIAISPQTASYLADPSFMMKIRQLQHPESIGQHLQDQRAVQVMGIPWESTSKPLSHLGLDQHPLANQGRQSPKWNSLMKRRETLATRRRSSNRKLLRSGET